MNHLRKIQLSSIICAKHFYCIQILGITIIADYNPSFSRSFWIDVVFPCLRGPGGYDSRTPNVISSWLMAGTEKPSLCRAGCKGPQHFCTASLHTLLFLSSKLVILQNPNSYSPHLQSPQGGSQMGSCC